MVFLIHTELRCTANHITDLLQYTFCEHRGLQLETELAVYSWSVCNIFSLGTIRTWVVYNKRERVEWDRSAQDRKMSYQAYRRYILEVKIFFIASVTSRCRICQNFIFSQIVKHFRIFIEHKFLCVLHKRPPLILHTKSLKFSPHSGTYHYKLILILFCHILSSTQPLSSLQGFKKRFESTGYNRNNSHFWRHQCSG